MKACTSGLPGGIQLGCLAYLPPIDNVIITADDVSFTRAEILSLLSWKTEIQDNLDVYVPAAVENYEPSTDDPQVVTTGSLRKTTIRKAPPSGTFYLRSNVCDFNEVMRALDGGTYRVMFINSDGSIGGYKDGINYKGFKAEVTAVTSGIAPQDGGQDMFKLMIHFFNYFEFQSQFNLALDWSALAELPNAMPESLSMDFESEDQATATVVVDIFERCGAAKAGVVIADIEIIDDTMTDSTVTAVTPNGSGNYDIVMTTAAAGQWVKFRVKIGSSPTTDISGPLFVEFD